MKRLYLFFQSTHEFRSDMTNTRTYICVPQIASGGYTAVWKYLPDNKTGSPIEDCQPIVCRTITQLTFANKGAETTDHSKNIYAFHFIEKKIIAKGK